MSLMVENAAYPTIPSATMDNDRKTMRILALTVIFRHGPGVLIITVYVKIEGKWLLLPSSGQNTLFF